ncbi:MAG: YtfJ family protein [Halioglobus sp.]
MTPTKYLFVILLGTLASVSHADFPTVASALPSITIEDRGEILLYEDEYRYAPWYSHTNPGTVHIVQYLAGTLSASKAYRPFTDQVKEQFGFEKCHVTTIINIDDAMWGTKGFVISEVEASKREFPHSTMVLDADGSGRKAWELKKKGTALAIIDERGNILFFTDTTMSEADIEAGLKLIASEND